MKTAAATTETSPATTTTRPATLKPTTAPGQRAYNIADFYTESGQLPVTNGDIVIVGKRQYRVVSDYMMEYWSQSSLDASISWWTEYLDSCAESGVVIEM